MLRGDGNPHPAGSLQHAPEAPTPRRWHSQRCAAFAPRQGALTTQVPGTEQIGPRPLQRSDQIFGGPTKYAPLRGGALDRLRYCPRRSLPQGPQMLSSLYVAALLALSGPSFAADAVLCLDSVPPPPDILPTPELLNPDDPPMVLVPVDFAKKEAVRAKGRFYDERGRVYKFSSIEEWVAQSGPETRRGTAKEYYVGTEDRCHLPLQWEEVCPHHKNSPRPAGSLAGGQKPGPHRKPSRRR